MRDQLKVIIGFDSTWGVFVFGGILLTSFTLGVNDTAPEMLAFLLYAFTMLPSCIMAIWYKVASGFWLIALSMITLVGLTYQVVVQGRRNGDYGLSISSSVAWMILFTTVPALLGVSLLCTRPLDRLEDQRG